MCRIYCRVLSSTEGFPIKVDWVAELTNQADQHPDMKHWAMYIPKAPTAPAHCGLPGCRREELSRSPAMPSAVSVPDSVYRLVCKAGGGLSGVE